MDPESFVASLVYFAASYLRDRGVSLHFHQFNENRNPTDVILNDILALMQELEKHFLDNFQDRQ